VGLAIKENMVEEANLYDSQLNAMNDIVVEMNTVYE
jgi:hypothetical protein